MHSVELVLERENAFVRFCLCVHAYDDDEVKELNENRGVFGLRSASVCV